MALPRRLGIKVRDYYDPHPSSANSAGDIWTGLPFHGFLGTNTLPGIVVTPACDLMNRKVGTLTYLPIIPIRSYFSTSSYLPEIYRLIESNLSNARQRQSVPEIELTRRYIPPPDAVRQQLRQIASSLQDTKAGKEAKVLLAASDILDLIASPHLHEVPAEKLDELLGERNLRTLVHRLVGNSQSLDLHFLPADGQDADWSGIKQHSLVLFRYAFSAPVELFDCAQDTALSDWPAVVRDIGRFYPGVSSFEERPMKRLNLKTAFLSDLLTRYVALHVRLGSPDFTEERRTRLVDEALSH